MKMKATAQPLFRFAAEVCKQFFRDRCPQRAAGLAYSTLLAIVPLFTVLLGFGGNLIERESVQAFLAETLLPTSQETILSAIRDFALNSSRFGAMGLLIFLVTIVILLNNIEIQLSTIFRIRSEKTILMRFTTYTAVLVFAGLFIGASITLSGNLFNSLLKTYGIAQISTRFMRQISSFLFIFMTLLTLICLMPSGKIRLPGALIGAGCGSVFWEIAKRLFSAWMNHSVRISVIYGSLFLIPLLLIWLFVAWMLILLSAEITYVHQNREFCYFTDTMNRSPGSFLKNGIRLYSFIAEQFMVGKEAPQLPDLSRRLNLPDMEIEKLLDLFLDSNMLHRVRMTSKWDGYVPAIPPKKQPLDEILLTLVFGSKERGRHLTSQPEDRILLALDTALKEILAGKTAGTILDEHD
jgi:membrane protein